MNNSVDSTSFVAAPSHFRNDIQGLRALAVFAVVFFHVNREWLPGGYTGVDMFFVISGYLVGGIILRQKETGNFSFWHFYLARARRIIPAYLFMSATVAIIAAIIFTVHDFHLFQQSAHSALYFFSNQYFSKFGDYFAPSSDELPLLHTWSLAVEMQFYVLLPPLLILLPRQWIRKILPVIIVFSLVLALMKRLWAIRKPLIFLYSFAYQNS